MQFASKHHTKGNVETGIIMAFWKPIYKVRDRDLEEEEVIKWRTVDP